MIWFLPLFLFLFALFYFAVMRKNEFEKHLTNFYPYRQLPQKREAYMQKVGKYNHIMFALFFTAFLHFSLCIVQRKLSRNKRS